MNTANNSERILVTGSAGFIGTNLGLFLEDAGLTWCGIDRMTPRHRTVAERTTCIDLQRSHEATSVIENFRPSTIIHLAARTNLEGRSVSSLWG